ncbi:MAG: methionine--tRNA ligase [Planctomycetota bacterium]
MSSQPYYITTAIDYVNSRPHLGTAYEKICADAIARFRRLEGDDVLFLMGNDEHSLKVEIAAREKGLSALEHCDQMEVEFQKAWAALDVEFDDFIRTTEDRHKATVREIIGRIHAAGDIRKDKYKGWYCAGCEAFKNEGDLEEVEAKGGKPSQRCPEHPGSELTWLEESNYFFNLSKYNGFLLEHYENNPDFVQPVVRRNEMLELLRSGLHDISISRESANWGIPLPFDEDAVIYVWFDALINYVSATGWPENQPKYERYWPADLHLIGKDITRFHCVIWPAMLASAGLPLPKKIFGHGFVNMGKNRMSKTMGTRVDPIELSEQFGVDALRYYLMAETSFGRDLEYTAERLVVRSNAELANGLGNLVSRTISMIVKYRDGLVPDPSANEPSLIADAAENARKALRISMATLDLKGAIEGAMSIVDRANLLVDQEAPWALAKDESKKDRLDRVLYDLAEACRIASVLLHPFMPRKMAEIRKVLKSEIDASALRLSDADFGLLKPGTQLEKISPVFPRLELEEAD